MPGKKRGEANSGSACSCLFHDGGLPGLGPLQRKYPEKSNISPSGGLQMSLVVKSKCLLSF